MAKKTLNPADAYRKAQRKKELKKNKTERSKARDFALVKKDTAELEGEIEKLEEEARSTGKADPRLSELKSELEKINTKKAEYVEEHPEARKLVYRARRREGDKEEDKPARASRNMFNKKGLPRHPERSIYYDPIMNPFGVPPPGMPYMERPLRPDEIDSDVEMDDGDDDIPLPPGLPPGCEEVGSDEDIPLPEGPPPGQEDNATSSPLPPQGFSVPGVLPTHVPPLPPTMFPGNIIPFQGNFVPPPPPGFPSGSTGNVPPPPPGPPPPPPGFPPNGALLPGWPSNLPPPPPQGFPPFPQQLPNFPPNAVPFSSLPPPPPGFFPRKVQSSASLQDPLSFVPHQTYQAHRASQLAAPHPSLPPKPTTNAPNSAAATMSANATVEAAPQLRDFKKEATAFIPTSIKRKKAGVASSSPAINAAPAVGVLGPDNGSEDSVDSGPSRPDLVSTLRSQFPVPKAEVKPKDDYTKFVEEMGDILGPN